MNDRPLDRAIEPMDGRSPAEALRRAKQQARYAILWERLWPPLAAIATAIGLFLALSWLGLWLLLPPLGRAVGVGLAALLLAAAAIPLVRLRLPTEAEALHRLDRLSGRRHRPATAMADELANSGDPGTLALWRAHVERALLAAKGLRAGAPRPLVAARDPVALRALVALLVIASFVAAGGERWRRVGAAFDWHGAIAPTNFRVDAWVNPPAYTGRPPVMLPGLRPGEPAQSVAAITVPTGSVLVLRATGDIRLDLTTSGGLTETDASAAAAPQGTPAATVGQKPQGAQERHFTIAEAGSATLRTGLISDVTWSFSAVPDHPPTIELTKEPEQQARGALKFGYKVEDDYGVAEARATFALVPQQDAPERKAHALYDAPDFPLNLPQPHAKRGATEMMKDLTEHPWAGAQVRMVLTAKDDAKQEGHSAAAEFRLPERPFTKPLARALIEQRRDLALDAETRDHVLTALDALAIAPEQFGMEAGIYLGLRSIFWQLSNAKSDDDLRDVVQRLWSMAVTIEDGNVSDAEQALRAAQDALREALERGASDEEIKRLTDNLRAALDKFLQAMAEQMRKNPQQATRPLDRNAQMLRPQDLQSMIDRLEQMARSGAKDAARQLLQQLQQMLENLQMAQPNMSPNGGMDDEMMQSLDQLGDMIRRQQQLRDRTYQQGQNQRGQRGQRGQQGQQGQQGQNEMSELQQNQQALRDQLRKLLEQLRQRGMGQPGQPGEQEMQQLGRAGDAMGEAEGQLGEGNAGDAVDSQGRALDALRRGAQSLAQMMQQDGNGPGPGQPGRLGQPRADRDTDPLGRPLRGRDYGDDVTVKVPGEIDVQRARRILEELRRRFADPQRPQLELDYLERLLKGFN